MGAKDYTQWAIKYPWHVSGAKEGKYPKDSKGYCTCTCQYCKRKTHKVTTRLALIPFWEAVND